MENKKSTFSKILSAVGTYFKKLGLSIADSFKYNPAKIAMLFLLVPCIVLGFCLTFHFTASKAFTVFDANIQMKLIEAGKVVIPDSFMADAELAVRKVAYANEIAQHQYSGFQLFALMVLGAVMMFVSVNVSGKRSLASCIQATLATAGIILFGVFWIKNFYTANEIYNIQKLTEYSNGTYSIWSGDNFVSIICVIIAMATSVIGTVLAFIFRDKTYKKDTM